MERKLVSGMLIATMLLSMTACGGNADNKKGSDGDTAAAVDADSLEPVTLTMYFHGSNVTDDSAVMEKVNEYLKDKINVTLKPIWGTWGDFDQNSVLALQGGDDVDIYFTCSWSADEYNKFARDGYWVRLDDPDNNLIEQYGQDLWGQLPEVLTNGATINGSDGYGVYAVPGYKDIATQNCWDVNMTRMEELGYTDDDLQHLDYFSDEFAEMLKKGKEAGGEDFYPLLVEGAVLERMVTNSIIVVGDSPTGNFMSYYIDPNDVSKTSSYGDKILNKFATDEFKKFAEKTYEYYQAGYIDPSMANANQANEVRSSKQLTGDYLIGTQSYALGYELQASQERGIKVKMVPCTDPYVDTTSSQGAMMAISTSSKNPERAMMFLNLLNTDPTLMTLLNYGVEGVHYNLTDDGLVKFTEKRNDYQPWTNGVGNVTILPATEAQGAGFWDTFKDYYGNAKEVPCLGYSYDPTNCETQMGSCANVVAEYMLPLCTGAVNPDEKIPEFLKKLEDVGVNDVLDDANAQLESFMAEKNN